MRTFCISLLIGLFSFTASAAHILGGEMTYRHLSGSEYEVTLVLYRDCGGIPFEDTLDITAFNSDDNSVFSQVKFFDYDLFRFEGEDATDDPCITVPDEFCVERAIYVDTFNLPSNANGYYLTYQRGNNAASIVNIVAPSDRGITLTTTIPPNTIAAIPNSSPAFSGAPPVG